MRVSEDGVLDALDSVVHTSQGERRKCKFAQGLSFALLVASGRQKKKRNLKNFSVGKSLSQARRNL